MKLYGGCVEDVLGVSVWSSSLSPSTDSSEFSSSSSSSSASSGVHEINSAVVEADILKNNFE